MGHPDMWIQTYTGKKFDFENLADNEYDIRDIVHSLAMQPRYLGHCVEFYSIAEHCALLYDFCLARGMGLDLAYTMLMHDASEAYISDFPAPFKDYLRARDAYAVIEGLDRQITGQIAIRHRVPMGKVPIVKELDLRIRADEAARNMSPCQWDNVSAPLGIDLKLWAPRRAEDEFMIRYETARFHIGYGPVL